LSYGQVIQNEGEQEEAKSGVMDAVRPPVDGTYTKVHIPHYKPVGLPYLREADVLWSKLIWQVLDLRQKFNYPLYYPTEKKGNWKSFMQSIMDATDSTEANPTPLRIYRDEYVNIPFSIAEVKSNMGETKIQTIFDEETWEEVGQKELYVEIGSKEVYRYVVKEQWRIDKQRSVMDQVIIAICPMFSVEKEGVDDGGGGADIFGEDNDSGSEEEDDMPAVSNRRWREFGWIYYPEIRPTMAVTEVFNPNNNAQRRNYDDLFLQRRFASFIRTEENVQDNRDINLYVLNGMDQALEAERIKEKLRTREHDMWEY
jgi:hypothetical protein